MKIIAIRNIVEPARRFHGKDVPARIYAGQNADIVPGVSIRLFGEDPNYTELKPHDITFKVGGTCVVGSYNFIYTGKILAITAKTVTVSDDGKARRMALHEFNRRNAHYDAQYIAERNDRTSQVI